MYLISYVIMKVHVLPVAILPLIQESETNLEPLVRVALFEAILSEHDFHQVLHNEEHFPIRV